MSKIVNESILVFSRISLQKKILWKLSTFRGYKGIYSRVREECEKLVFIQTGHSNDLASWLELVASLSREITSRPDCIFCPVVLQLSLPFSSLHASLVCHFGDFSVASQSWDRVARLLWMHTSWVFFTLSHTLPLQNFHLNTRYLIVKLQANLAQNKANTWLNNFNFTEVFPIRKQITLSILFSAAY